jgi:hypothetical protein
MANQEFNPVEKLIKEDTKALARGVSVVTAVFTPVAKETGDIAKFYASIEGGKLIRKLNTGMRKASKAIFIHPR